MPNSSQGPSTPPGTWSGRVVRLRAGQPEDVGVLARARLEDHETMREHGEGFVPPPPSRAAVLEELTEPSDRGAAPGDLNLVIARLDDDLCVGSICAFRTRAQSGALWLALTIFAEHRRQGFAADAVTALLRGYFDELRYHKANVGIYAHNAASVALFEGLGFRPEGRLREVRYSRGVHHDELVYGITAPEFRSRTPTP